MLSCPVCGPKLSVCCTILSVWGIVMLALMGVFYQIHSVALFEDIPLNHTKWEEDNFPLEDVHKAYEQTGLNCFIAAGIYVLFFFFSCWQQRLNSKANYETS
ncbi:hypothetical protein FSP39_019119 [Pinctada imbricata]|uniref:Uncharacterized protein n=1 Tax=Pinctada imbricata TaxID=66713 RepID=A0AA89C2D3_PINIB|nr:hypothetical protein FSP39_019119 [Pinctada imbricata]